MSLLGGIGKAAKKVGGFTAKHAFKASVGKPGNLASRGINRAMDAGLNSTKSLVSKTDATFYNGYTGLRPSALGNTLGLAAIAGTTLYGIGKVVAEPISGPTEFEGEAPIMTADGMGSGTKAPTMNASGSLVFGLNNMRRG